MTDNLSPNQRKHCMSQIRSKDTKPELKVRRLLHSLGYRFRLHYSILPGKPDIVMPKYKTAIFVNGCYWHGHRCKRGMVKPKTNLKYWKNKIANNKLRDKMNRNKLRKMNWKVIVIWECWTKNPSKLQYQLKKHLSLGV